MNRCIQKTEKRIKKEKVVKHMLTDILFDTLFVAKLVSYYGDI